MTALSLLVRHGEQMDVEGDAVAGAQRMFAVGKNFDPGKEAGEQGLEACAGEEILVVGFEQVPRHNAPIVEVGQ